MPFINRYNFKEINYSLGNDDWKKFEKIIHHLLLMCYLVKKQYIP